jgi:colicin import membrane protein
MAAVASAQATRTRARNRWMLAVTLSRNPALARWRAPQKRASAYSHPAHDWWAAAAARLARRELPAHGADGPAYAAFVNERRAEAERAAFARELEALRASHEDALRRRAAAAAQKEAAREAARAAHARGVRAAADAAQTSPGRDEDDEGGAGGAGGGLPAKAAAAQPSDTVVIFASQAPADPLAAKRAPAAARARTQDQEGARGDPVAIAPASQAAPDAAGGAAAKSAGAPAPAAANLPGVAAPIARVPALPSAKVATSESWETDDEEDE